VIVNYSTGTIGVPVEKELPTERVRPEVAALKHGASMNVRQVLELAQASRFSRWVFAEPL